MSTSVRIPVTERFQILVEPRSADGDPASRRLAVRLGDVWLTRLIRRSSDQPDHCLEAPPLPLAFWFLDNWWRIRCEPPPPQRDFPAHWRIAHHLPSVGAGYPWPNISLWGEGPRCAVMVHADAHSLQRSVRFVAEPTLEYVTAKTAENAIDSFIRRVLQDVGSDCDSLDEEYRDLCAERADPAVSRWRRLEALLGFDPDAAPEPLVSEYESMTKRFGTDGIEEAALAQQGDHSTSALQDILRAARNSRVTLRTPPTIAEIKLDHSPLHPPWRLAVGAARELRRLLRVPAGPIRNPRLSEVLNINVNRLATQSTSPRSIPYGLRLRNASGNVNRLALRSRWSHSRRFELCRSLGDIIWSGNDALGPLSSAKSGRQKFQRAFAQEFLCPFDDLRAYIPNEDPADDDIHAAARHFHVSERLIQTTFVNHNVINRETFEQMVEAA